MFRNFGRVMAIAAIGCAFIGATDLSTPAFAGGGTGNGAREPRLEGILVSVSSPTVTIRLKNGTSRSITITGTTKIERNGRTASLAAFRTGDRVQARFTANGSAVVKFEGVGP